MEERILVIIVTFNGINWLDRCLFSLVNSEHKVDAIIIDNGSSDGTQKYIQKHFPKFILKQSKTNLGFGGANNIGLKYALLNEYDYVYLLNQDAWIYPNTVSELIKASKANPDFGIISPLQYCGDEESLDSGFEHIYKSVAKQNIDTIEVPFIMAAHWFIPSSVIKVIGGFSPTFFHYGEDNNFIDRLHYYGYKVGVAKAARAVHDRQNRPVSREKSMYLKKTSSLIRLSSPLHPIWESTLSSFVLSTAFAVKCKSIQPIFDFFDLLRQFSSIKINRKISKKDQAFL